MPDARDVSRHGAADKKDIIRQPAKLIELTLEDPSTANPQRALIAAAEATRLSTSENRGACHGLAILPLAEYA